MSSPPDYVTLAIALPSGLILGILSTWFVMRRRERAAATGAVRRDPNNYPWK